MYIIFFLFFFLFRKKTNSYHIHIKTRNHPPKKPMLPINQPNHVKILSQSRHRLPFWGVVHQVISAFYDQSGSLVMGPRTGTPMRLVSPAPPVLVPPSAAGPRAPQAPPAIYPPQTAQQSMYSAAAAAQNGSNIGGNDELEP